MLAPHIQKRRKSSEMKTNGVNRCIRPVFLSGFIACQLQCRQPRIDSTKNVAQIFRGGFGVIQAAILDCRIPELTQIGISRPPYLERH